VVWNLKCSITRKAGLQIRLFINACYCTFKTEYDRFIVEQFEVIYLFI
jgi:hypothetical protein